MKKGLFLSVAFLVLFILLSGCTKEGEEIKEQPDTNGHKKPTIDTVKEIPYKQFFELKSGVSTNLNAISYYNSAKGIAVGDSGTILLTKNGGHDWRSVGGVKKVNLYGVAIANSLIAIAVGEKGTILRSNNGGETWDTVRIDFSGTLRAVAFYSCKNGYTVGDGGSMFFTDDFGVNWKKVGNSSENLNAIAFNKNNRPQVVGDSGIYFKGKGDDTSFSGGVIPTVPNLRGIHFIPGSDEGFAVGDKGVIFKTTNGGNNWNTVPSPVAKNLRGVLLYSSKLGYAVGDGGTVLGYNGTSWVLLTTSTMESLNAVDPVYWNPSSTCVGENGLIMLINPPPVNDNGTFVTLDGQEDCIWTVTITTKSLRDKSPMRIIYRRLQVCSSIEQSDMEVVPGSGWVLREEFQGISDDLEPDQVYPSEGHPLNSITLLMNPYGDVTSGYFSCYLMDEQENIYLLSTYEIVCE